MILSLAGKYRKTIATFLASIFCLQLLLPLAAQAEGGPLHLPQTIFKRIYANEFANSLLLKNDRNNEVDKADQATSIESNKQISHQGKSLKAVNDKKSKPAIGGPGQPETSSFQSVNGNNLVDLFSGDFAYNIPLMDVGGYPINIHYNSGVTMDQEASWVGLGWNINPGAVTRNMRGLPDDFNGKDVITKTQSIKTNQTTGVKVGGQAEMVGLPLTIGFGGGVFHNNYNGWGVEQSLNAAISISLKQKGDLNAGDSSSLTAGASLSLGNNSQTGLSVGASINVALKKMQSADNSKGSNFGLNTNYHTRGGLSSLTIHASANKSKGWINNKGWGVGHSESISFAQPSITPGISMSATSENFIFHVKGGGELFGMHPNTYIEGYVTKQSIKKEDQVKKVPAYGYLYFTDANANQNALLDFNREKETQFTYSSTPAIAIPQYTYDVYSISGEGTGGTIRPYRGDVGYVRDHYMRTKSSNKQFSGELGLGGILHGGFSYDYVDAYTQNSSWQQDNDLANKAKFQSNTDLYQSVYFRNPGEKTSNTASYYKSIGGDALMRVKLDKNTLSRVKAMNRFVTYKDGNVDGELAINSALRKEERDKRSQVITYLNAADAVNFGLDKKIFSYKENTIPIGSCTDTIELISRIDGSIHRENHLSEIDVLNADGRRYVYGLPAYNIEQKDVTFSVNKEGNANNLDSGLVKYDVNQDNSVNNNKGKENYFNQEAIPSFAHSFLLTGILSPDYVDIKEDGITPDDLGDAVKFNYTRVYGSNQNFFEWRTPGTAGKATYNEGFKTYSRDDKATYLYGKKEVWYTHSIESKTMIALFKLSADRRDAYAAAGENGGINKNKPLRKLERIELYTKADLLKNGKEARPVKTVHFEYTYELCKGYLNIAGEGKLTLKKIWFTYNKNDKGKLNPYTFNYAASNPNYHPKKYDRWGNYKESTLNPDNLNNADFPYAVQDSSVAAQNASAWHLSNIKLPSGGQMKVTYESDDYAYVQDKRATQMFTLAGFGKTPASKPTTNLYNALDDNEYVFINSTVALADAGEVFKKYLEGNEYLYMKMAVVMPTDRWGSGYEFVPVYGKVAAYGKVSNTNMFWLKFEPVAGTSPMVRAALQFLRNNLTSKAYPTSELGDNISLGDAVRMLASSVTEIRNSVLGFETASKIKGWCKGVFTAKSFIRLNSPNYTKLGGGLRVKRVEIFDNWNAMTTQKESIYGQEYNYKTAIEVGGKTQTISSGVATYEPMIGGEENPFRQPITYSEQVAPLAPVSFLYSEMPLGESYFPGASVGYSKVRVRTINTKAKSANGWEESEFYTAKDFPTIVEHTMLDQDAKARYKPKLPNLLKVYSVEKTTVSQGFKIELNDMNGKVKKTASYAENDSINPISYSLNFYKVDNDRAVKQKLNNTVWVVDSINGKINKEGIIGKDIEVMMDLRQQFSSSTSGGISPNLDLMQIGPFPLPIPSFFKFPQVDESQFRSAATVKIIQRYAILDSVVVMDKGSVVNTKNLLYDGQTGEVVLSRTNNEFNDPIYNFSYPAHWAYSGMDMAYKNVQAEFKDLEVIHGRLYYPGGRTVFPSEKYFESGDELWLTGVPTETNIGEKCFELVTGLGSLFLPPFRKAWVMDAGKGNEGHTGLYIIDKDGKPLTGRVSSIKVLRSGKRNMLSASAGSVVAMENPMKEVSADNWRLVIDSNLQVINTSAATYKDLWAIDNSFYEKDTVIKVNKSFSKILELVMVSRKSQVTERSRVLFESFTVNAETVLASYDFLNARSGCASRSIRTLSILNFNLDEIPSTAAITRANLSFVPKVPDANIPGTQTSCNSPEHNYNWGNATNYFIGDSRVNVRRITSPWTNQTFYNSLVSYGSTTNQIEFNSNVTNAECKTLIQDAIQNKTFGFMFTTTRNDNNGLRETNYLSFCGHLENPTRLPCNNKGVATTTSMTAPSYAPPICNCSKPQLYVEWTAAVDSTIKVCRSNINDQGTNPYRWGILGNWRIDRAYTYYHDRKESDANVKETDIRKEGTLKSFTPYWKFTDNGLQTNADPAKWVWNSALSGYNRKGFETENYDPLGRYNAGLYGYNQTLPVAVAQNSKYKEMMFDGFEDYGYKTTSCTTCDSPREFDFVKNQSGVSLNEDESHTGNYSLHVNAGSSSNLIVPLTAVGMDKPASLSIKIDSTIIYPIKVVGKGRGLSGAYTGAPIINGACIKERYFTVYRIDPIINFNWGNSPPIDGICVKPRDQGNNSYTVEWKGFVQAKYTGNYTFYLDKSRGACGITATLKNVQRSGFGNITSTNIQTNAPIHMQAGEICTISFSFNRFRDDVSANIDARAALSWSAEGLPKEIIPTTYLYPFNFVERDSIGSIIRGEKVYCISTNSVKPLQVIRPTFSPYQESKMVVSGWVKIDGTDCGTVPVLTNVITANFNDADKTVIALQKTGVRIEGWQRYEAVVDVPKKAAQLMVKLAGVQGRSVFVDDIRIQPFSSNLKSYVYDPVNLRLQAELDENNYAAFYEYDDDGTLIRVKKETEKGIMTIKETRSALLKN